VNGSCGSWESNIAIHLSRRRVASSYGFIFQRPGDGKRWTVTGIPLRYDFEKDMN
jgi:hypothetical protein